MPRTLKCRSALPRSVDRCAPMPKSQGFTLMRQPACLTKSGEGCIIRIMPFVNSWERKIHFSKHGHEFGVGTEEEYELMADSFMFGGMTHPTQECTRPNLVDRLRFNGTNRHFGVVCVTPVFIRTFYRVRPAKIARHG